MDGSATGRRILAGGEAPWRQMNSSVGKQRGMESGERERKQRSKRRGKAHRPTTAADDDAEESLGLGEAR